MVVVFPVPLTPTMSVTCGLWPFGRRTLDAVEDLADLVLHQIAQALAVARSRSHGRHNSLGRRQTDIGRDQQLFECFDRVDRNRPRALLACVGLLDDLFEAADDLLLRPRQAFAKAV